MGMWAGGSASLKESWRAPWCLWVLDFVLGAVHWHPHAVAACYWMPIWSTARVQIIPAGVCSKLHGVNCLQINLAWTLKCEELMWCAKVSCFLLRPCLFAGSCHGSPRNTDPESGRFGMAKSSWITFCTKAAISLLGLSLNWDAGSGI